ncbi:D-inositol-3-phosphate glycosyltransferase [Streptomyces sp. RB5]|uniref:D-inositol 3-phosphate glycosyltransferase n=1 Tax=Streptomyces smaragdinus TaxID=2585196 RepID=A0A7K0CBA9_9ACTN|nr:glycosyltransferase family 4 protein [Streptomyces smaragdinus]MQY10740.1 D-inositol-3-phosphate glycosyltransferase [Streptomyces smaragdinus]
MRILLAQNLIHLPSHGGANRSNRLMLEELARRGHTCVVVGPLTGALATTGGAVEALRRRGAEIVSDGPEAVVYRYAGVESHAVRTAAALPGRIRRVAADLAPDFTLVPSDDPGFVVLGAVLAVTPDRVVYLVHTLQQLPFGPGAFYPSAAGTAMVRRTAAVVSVSLAAQRYVQEHAGLESTLVRPHVYGDGPYPDHGAAGPDGRSVTLINPCGYKGISVLLDLADSLPEVPFLTVPTWGTQPADLAALSKRGNIELTGPVDDIDTVFRRSSVLLMPSLWDETFGYSAVEAQLRGIPVLASAVGGLAEAELGVAGTLPVTAVSEYAARAGQARPEPVIPPQDVAPWRTALRELLEDGEVYRARSAASRVAAHAFVEGLDPGALETFLAGVTPSAAPERAAAPAPDRAAALRALAARRARTGK